MHQFHIPGMTCGGCLRAVIKAVHALDPHAQVEGDSEARTVKVVSDREEASLLEALSKGGYPARSL